MQRAPWPACWGCVMPEPQQDAFEIPEFLDRRGENSDSATDMFEPLSPDEVAATLAVEPDKPTKVPIVPVPQLNTSYSSKMVAG